MALELHFFLAAAGSGQRFQAGKNKLLVKWAGQELISYLFKNLAAYARVCQLNQDFFKLQPKLLKPTQANSVTQFLAENLSMLETADPKYLANQLSGQTCHFFWHLICQEHEEMAFIKVLKSLYPDLEAKAVTKSTGKETNGFRQFRFSLLSVTGDPQEIKVDFLRGSSNRQASIAHAYQSFIKYFGEPQANSLAFIHDAARLNISASLLNDLLFCALLNGNAIPYLPVNDTTLHLNYETSNNIKTATASSSYQGITDLNREQLIRLQTPQVFSNQALYRLYRELPQAQANPHFYAAFTDDSAIYRKYVGATYFVLGQADNYKLTNPSDLALVAAQLEDRK